MTRGLPLTLERACHDRVAPGTLLVGEARAQLKYHQLSHEPDIVESCAISRLSIYLQRYEEILPPYNGEYVMGLCGGHIGSW